MPTYPPARRLDLVEQLHGHQVADPYRWLEEPDAAETQEWVEAQERLTSQQLDQLPERDWFKERLAELLNVGAVSVPGWEGGRAFWLRRDPGQEHPVLWCRDGEGVARPLLDPAQVDPSGLTTLDGGAPSQEGRLLAYQLSTGGTEESALRVLDVDTGEIVDGPIGRTRYSPVAWLPGGEEFFYVRRLPPDQVPAGEEQFHRRVYRHRVGADPAEDVLVFGDGRDPRSYFGVSTSLDGRWLLVSASVGTEPQSDVWLFDLTAADPYQPVEVQVGVRAVTRAWVHEGRLWLQTDRDAPRGRLCVADPADPQQWTTVLPEDPESVLEQVAHLSGGRLAVHRTRHALSELTVQSESGELVATVALPGPGTVQGLSTLPEGGPDLWFGWTDAGTPPMAYRWRDGELGVWAEPAGGGERVPLFTRQLSFPSRDGTTVRATLVSGSAEPAGPRPLVLYGYGGFAVSLSPGWNASARAWVEAGGVWVQANLRGGSEEGEDWHRAGMRANKQNVFDDFAACAGYLVEQGWTTRELGIYGGSNGGLLVGAALTQRPDAYAAVVCSAPLLDMVRYELFGLGRTWNDEYGTADDPTELGWLLSYSPYHQVREGVGYPAVLFTVFEGDTRVDVLHARKMCAALQHATSAQAPVLFRLERGVGHGARAVSRTVGLTADLLAFLAHHAGLRVPA